MELPAKRVGLQQYRMIGRPWCARLGSHIFFGRKGFEHLLRKHGIERPKAEQIRRLKLIPYIADIINDPGSAVSQREKTVKRGIMDSRVRSWVITGERNNMIIKVIIRQFEGREKHFWSVYTKKPSGKGRVF